MARLIGLPRWVKGLGAALALLSAVYIIGRQHQAADAALSNIEVYHDTILRIDQATVGDPGPDAARERLRRALGE
ncbi:MAG: hypothetical protein AAF376_08875 [Pseudomonadota bacterium]